MSWVTSKNLCIYIQLYFTLYISLLFDLIFLASVTEFFNFNQWNTNFFIIILINNIHLFSWFLWRFYLRGVIFFNSSSKLLFNIKSFIYNWFFISNNDTGLKSSTENEHTIKHLYSMFIFKFCSEKSYQHFLAHL